MTSTGFIDSLVLIWKSGVGFTVTSQTLGSLAYPDYTIGKAALQLRPTLWLGEYECSARRREREEVLPGFAVRYAFTVKQLQKCSYQRMFTYTPVQYRHDSRRY